MSDQKPDYKNMTNGCDLLKEILKEEWPFKKDLQRALAHESSQNEQLKIERNFFDDRATKLLEECSILEAENERLKKILAQEASENDELGAEYILVTLQREEIGKLKVKIEKLREAMIKISKCEKQYVSKAGITFLAKEALKDLSDE